MGLRGGPKGIWSGGKEEGVRVVGGVCQGGLLMCPGSCKWHDVKGEGVQEGKGRQA